jgi:DNA polymerase-3 subunit epsilon
MNFLPTGNTFHRYINPQRAMSPGAFAVHGLSDEFLADKPLFSTIADELHAFLGDARLVIHNAAFDMGFLNAEFTRSGHRLLELERALDTLHLARKKHTGASNTLDALCSRYGIDNTKRTKHGALLDAELLAEVYLELIGGRQPDLAFASVEQTLAAGSIEVQLQRRERPVVSRLSDAERAAHAGFVASLGSAPIWAEYLGSTEG